jgi:hypothetical protein
MKMTARACMVAFVGLYFHRNPGPSQHQIDKTNPPAKMAVSRAILGVQTGVAIIDRRGYSMSFSN